MAGQELTQIQRLTDEKIFENKLRRFDESGRSQRLLEIARESVLEMVSAGLLAIERVPDVTRIEERKLALLKAMGESRSLMDLLDQRYAFLGREIDKHAREYEKHSGNPDEKETKGREKRVYLLNRQREYVDIKRKLLLEDITKMAELLAELEAEEQALVA